MFSVRDGWCLSTYVLLPVRGLAAAQFPERGRFLFFWVEPPPTRAAGGPGGPPLAAERRESLGAPIDIRSVFVDYVRHPDRLPKTNEELQAIFVPLKK